MVGEAVGAHRLARFGAAELHHVPAGRRAAEVVVEAHDAVHLGAGQVERGGDGGNRVGRHVAELVLDGVQDGQQGAGTMAILLDGGGDGRFPVDCGHTAAARVDAGMRARMKSAMAAVSFRSRKPGPSNGASVAKAMRSGSFAQSGALAERRAIDLDLGTALKVEALCEHQVDAVEIEAGDEPLE